MTRSPFISTGRERRELAMRRRRRRIRMRATGVIMLAVVAGLVIAQGLGRDTASKRTGPRPKATQLTPLPAAPTPEGPKPAPLVLKLAGAHDPVHVHFKVPPRSGLLFDLHSGRVLWRHNELRPRAIASLTKMMTALLVVERAPASAKVKITRQALAYHGSGVGVLPRNKYVRLETLLNGLLLPSGNDAAIALAQHVDGTVARFVRRMNQTAARLGLRCTHFTSPDGFNDTGRSCPVDLAVLASVDLRQPRIARIVRRRRAILPLPIKGGRIYLYNNNPLIRLGYPGINGLKTGYTNLAGHCLVATARRHGVSLGVVLLHSPDTGKQAGQLLDRGFRVK